jgi:hypothetical protein
VFNAAGAMVAEAANIPERAGTTAYTLTAQLEGDETYGWQLRAEAQGEAGPWSALATFVAPANTGYIRGNELYDPLANGVTIGEKHGPLTFIPGVGVRLETQLSYISYQLPQTLSEGEFSILVTGMPANTEGDKTKLFAMGQNYDDIVTNERRMTVEKRGDPAGVVAWRFITHDDQIDTEGADRQVHRLPGDANLLLAGLLARQPVQPLDQGGRCGRPHYLQPGEELQGPCVRPDAARRLHRCAGRTERRSGRVGRSRHYPAGLGVGPAKTGVCEQIELRPSSLDLGVLSLDLRPWQLHIAKV